MVSAISTAAILFSIALVYLTLCETYEAIRKNGFNDERGAVIISPSYIKVFDFEYYIG
ncbi:MAG: hypothetical protein IJP21_03735 [Clostridia bacterium]|nr:hypothetical protein [Clostridia bacterium]